MDGGPAVKIGRGTPFGLSPDARWALTRAPDGPLVLLPTGTDSPRSVDFAALSDVCWTRWLPDGSGILLGGTTVEGATQIFHYDLKTHAVLPVGEPGMRGPLVVKPDGSAVAGVMPDGQLAIQPLPPTHGPPEHVAWWRPGDVPLSFTADGRGLYAIRKGAMAPRIEVIDLATCVRELHHELTLPDPAGVDGIGVIHMTADGATYAYCYQRRLSQLYVIEGLS